MPCRCYQLLPSLLAVHACSEFEQAVTGAMPQLNAVQLQTLFAVARLNRYIYYTGLSPGDTGDRSIDSRNRVLAGMPVRPPSPSPPPPTPNRPPAPPPTNFSMLLTGQLITVDLELYVESYSLSTVRNVFASFDFLDRLQFFNFPVTKVFLGNSRNFTFPLFLKRRLTEDRVKPVLSLVDGTPNLTLERYTPFNREIYRAAGTDDLDGPIPSWKIIEKVRLAGEVNIGDNPGICCRSDFPIDTSSVTAPGSPHLVYYDVFDYYGNR